MCGIAGIIQIHPGTYGEEHVRKMTDALAHRGPDGEGFWQNENGTALLGHRRLAIIDLSDAGHQPLRYQNRYHIVHNGEVYNYIELRKDLEQKGYLFRSQTDTEVIVAAYDYWKSDCLEQLDGMFSFAIWDEKEKTFFAARDRFGEKPFFYFFDPNKKTLLFASEMKAFHAMGISKKPNLKMLFNFITIGYVENPERPEETFDEDLVKLPPAHYLHWQTEVQTEPEVIKYWQLDPESNREDISDPEAIERFSSLLQKSVKRRLRSDVPIGTSLSGGLDSSAICAVLQLIEPGSRHNAFTAVFPEFEKDESAFARQITDKYSLPWQQANIQPEDLLNDWDKLCQQQEVPFGSSSIYAQYKVYQLAKEKGITVLLDGQGADETLAGYHKYYKWYWQELFRQKKLFRSGELRAARKLGVREKFGFINMVAAFFPDLATVALEKRYLLRALRHEDLTKDFIQSQSGEAYYTIPSRYTLNEALHFNSCVHGLEELLRYADRNAMAHSREVRMPFLDHQLVEFVFSLPSHFKIRDGWTKWLLRKSMEGQLPETIAWRRDKTGFEPPQAKWMEHKGIQELIHASKKSLVEHKILKAEVLNKPISAHGAHEANRFDWRYLTSSILFNS